MSGTLLNTEDTVLANITQSLLNKNKCNKQKEIVMQK